MAFIDDWQRDQLKVPHDEVSLFKLFAELLAKHYTGVEYFVVHGKPGHVEFSSGIWPGKTGIVKEIGDLLIVTYSYKSREARYCVQQNKYERSSGALRTSPTLAFSADIYQYDLLAYRPQVNSVGSIPFPKDILSGTDYDSVGNYGVFYRGGNHLIDFAYSAARWLTPHSFSSKTKLSLNTFMMGFGVNGRDLLSTVGIQNFISALLEMRIGAPLVSRVHGQFLQGMINRAATANGRSPTVVDLPNLFGGNATPIPDGSAYRLLLINVDKNA